MITEVPEPPTRPLVASDMTKDSLTLSWQPPKYDGGSPVTGYLIDKIDLDQGGWVHCARLPADSTTHTVGNLLKNRRYNFRVYAQNKIGTSEPIELPDAMKVTTGVGMYLITL